MSNIDGGEKILGFVPREKYVQITYYLLLAASGVSFLTILLLLIGVFFPLAGIANLAGLAGLILGLVGYFGYKDRFNGLEQSHLLYLCILFGVFFVMGLILGAAFAFIFALMAIVMVVFNGLQLILIFTGFNAYSHGRSIVVEKENILTEVKLALKRA